MSASSVISRRRGWVDARSALRTTVEDQPSTLVVNGNAALDQTQLDQSFFGNIIENIVAREQP
jgi:hypothetical protein